MSARDEHQDRQHGPEHDERSLRKEPHPCPLRGWLDPETCLGSRLGPPDHGAHSVLRRRSSRRPANIITATMSTSLDHLRGVRVDRHRRQDRVEDEQDHAGSHRSHHRSDPAGQRDPPEDDRGDAVQRAVGGVRESRVAGGRDRGDSEAGKAGERASDSVRRDLGPPDVHAGQIRRIVIAADRVEGEPSPRSPQPDADDGHRQGQREQRGYEVGADPRIRAREDPAEATARPSSGRRQDHERDAGEDEQGRERDDDVGDA